MTVFVPARGSQALEGGASTERSRRSFLVSRGGSWSAFRTNRIGGKARRHQAGQEQQPAKNDWCRTFFLALETGSGGQRLGHALDPAWGAKSSSHITRLARAAKMQRGQSIIACF